MRNIRKIAVRLVLIALILILFESLVEFLYRPYDQADLYTIRELEECQGKIETLFLGTSTAHRAFAPEIFDEALDTFSFNLSTNIQPLSGTLHLLKEQARENPLERVFLGVSPSAFKKEDANTWQKVEVYDRLLTLQGKLSYLVEENTPEEWLDLALYSVREEEYGDFARVKENVAYKQSDAYRQNIPPGGQYRGKGYIARGKKFEGKTYDTFEKGTPTWEPNAPSEQSLIEIMEYCKEQGIELILTYIPATGKELIKYKDLSVIHDYFQGLADEYGTEFWDFNYYANLKEEFTNKMFFDKKHLNYAGSQKFSEIFAEIYQAYRTGQGVESYFLDACPYYKE